MTLPDALAAIVGFLLVVIGVAMYSVRTAFIVAGVILLVGGLWPKRSQDRKETVK